MTSREDTTAENVFVVPQDELAASTPYLVPKDLPNVDGSQYRPKQTDRQHRAFVVKLVAGDSTDADVDLEAAVTTADDTTFAEYIKEGTSDTALNGAGNSVPDTVAAIFSDEATVAGINAELTPQTDPTAGEYKVVIESRRY